MPQKYVFRSIFAGILAVILLGIFIETVICGLTIMHVQADSAAIQEDASRRGTWTDYYKNAYDKYVIQEYKKLQKSNSWIRRAFGEDESPIKTVLIIYVIIVLTIVVLIFIKWIRKQI